MNKPTTLAAMAVLVTTLACTSLGPTGTPQAPSEAPPLQSTTDREPGWSNYSDDSRHFSVSLPTNWKAGPPDPENIEAVFALFALIDPEKAAAYSRAEDWASEHVYLAGFEPAELLANWHGPRPLYH